MERRAADPPERRSQAGTGLIGSLTGFVTFIVLLLLAVQVLFDLYARSAVTAAAFDAARRVAGFEVATLPADELAAAESDAEGRARRTLGRYGGDARFTWTLTSTEVALRVRIVNPSLVPSGLGRPFGLDTIDRTVRVHAEHLICPTPSPCSVGIGR